MRWSALAITFLLGAGFGSAALALAGAERVVPLRAAEVRLSPAKNARITKLVQGKNAFLGKLEMDAGARVPLHRDATEEYIHVIEGGGKMMIDGKPYDVTPGATIYMPANCEVSFENSETRLVAIQVFAGPAPAKKYDAWTPVR